MSLIMTCLTVTNDPALLILAAVICVIGVYGSFTVTKHAGRSEGVARRKWVGVALIAAGCTAWATHMIALLAFRPGMQAGFEPFLTTLSLVLAIVGIGTGLLLSFGRRARMRRLAGGAIIGLGVAVLHYLGQSAYVVRGVSHWNYELVAGTIGLGLPLFGLSIVVAGERKRAIRLGLGAPLLLLSIAVVHLGGMAALRLEFDPRVQLPPLTVPTEVLAPIVAVVSFGLLCIAVVGLRLTLHAKAELKREQMRLGELANLALEGLAICEDNRIVTANDSLARLCGLPREDLAGSPLDLLLPEFDLTILREREEADLDLKTSIGGSVPVRVIRSEVRLSGRLQTVLAFRDQSERLRSEERIRTLAFYDPLTGLANRTSFHEALNSKVSARESAGTPFTLLLIDLDGFKDINDTLGHIGGDEVLQIVAERLRAAVNARHMIARLGGDEFGVLLEDSADPLQAATVGQSIISALEAPMDVQDQIVHISASVGIMPSGHDKLAPGEMLRAADLALYDAKANGRARTRLFTPELRRASIERTGIANDLEDAWDQRQFELYFQPQVDLADDRIVGAEALIRWNYPYVGVLAPGAFLSVLEAGRLAVPVGDWILTTACEQAADLRRLGANEFRIGVNLFAAQLRMPDFVERVEEALRASGLPADALELEITENIVLRSDRLTANHLSRIRGMGVGIAFDDFGTGFASLTMLKQLDITRLKIDRSFVREIETSRKDQGIVDAVVRMAEGCDLAVIAEGIETRSQANYLQSRVSEGQGYLFGKPMQIDDFSKMLARNACEAPFKRLST